MKSMKKYLLLSIIAAAVVMTACTAAFAAEDDDKWQLLIFVHSLDSEFWAQEAAGAELFAASKSDVVATVQTSRADDNAEIQGLKDFIAQHGKKAIAVFDPASMANTANIVDVCEEAGIYYAIAWHLVEGLYPEDYEHFVAHFSPDDVTSGYKTAVKLFEEMGKKGNVVYLHGVIGEDSAAGRFKGLQKAMEEYPDIKLLEYQVGDWDQEKAMSITETWLAKYDKIDGIACGNDTMALGAIEALKKAKLNGKVPVTGTDGIQAAFDAIKAGDLLCTVMNDGYLLFGYMAAYTYAAATGQPYESARYYTNTLLVEKGNVDEVIANYIKGTPTYDYSNLSFPIMSKRPKP
jgi:ABC-type sugar transport system substrate-binding protein